MHHARVSISCPLSRLGRPHRGFGSCLSCPLVSLEVGGSARLPVSLILLSESSVCCSGIASPSTVFAGEATPGWSIFTRTLRPVVRWWIQSWRTILGLETPVCAGLSNSTGSIFLQTVSVNLAFHSSLDWLPDVSNETQVLSNPLQLPVLYGLPWHLLSSPVPHRRGQARCFQLLRVWVRWSDSKPSRDPAEARLTVGMWVKSRLFSPPPVRWVSMISLSSLSVLSSRPVDRVRTVRTAEDPPLTVELAGRWPSTQWLVPGSWLALANMTGSWPLGSDSVGSHELVGSEQTSPPEWDRRPTIAGRWFHPCPRADEVEVETIVDFAACPGWRLSSPQTVLLSVMRCGKGKNG